MTREEAIDMFRSIDRYFCTTKETHDAIEMAIEALKEREKDGDLIKRQDVINEIVTWTVLVLRSSNAEMSTKLIGRIKALPSAESEEFEWCHDCKEYDQETHCCNRYTKAIRQAVDELKVERTGKWAYKTTDSYIQRTCSACGWSERMYHCNRNQDGLIRNYCPNCGARMENR